MARCLICFLSCLFIVESYRGRSSQASALFDKPHGHEYNIQNYYSHFLVNKKVQGTCQPREVNKLLKQLKCIPRETVVHLKSRVDGLQIVTDKVLVKRCLEVGCFSINSCVPTSTQVVRIPVLLWQGKCAWVEVKEHTACGCKCSVRAEHCSPNQEFLADQCACRCRNKEEKNECRRDGKVWDEKTCSCICPTEWMDCSTGTEWVPRMCK